MSQKQGSSSTPQEGLRNTLKGEDAPSLVLMA
jgi:hypothetical protein